MATVTAATSHKQDTDCTLSPQTDCCTVCGVLHGDPCPECKGRGYHNTGCSEYEESPVINTIAELAEQTLPAASASITMLQVSPSQATVRGPMPTAPRTTWPGASQPSSSMRLSRKPIRMAVLCGTRPMAVKTAAATVRSILAVRRVGAMGS
jgi:hypothetical protein